MINKLYYFSYGSNIKQSRLEARVGKVNYIGNHILNDYRLVFNCTSLYLDTYANIEEAKGQQVEGCLYELTYSQIAELDRYEVLYYKKFIDLPNNKKLVVYIAEPITINNKAVRPWLNYIDIILQGCLEKKLTSTYSKVLAFKEANYRIKRNKRFRRH